MGALVAGRIIVHHIDLSRHNHQFRANEFFSNAHHLAAACFADLLLLGQLAQNLPVLQTFGQVFFGALGFPGMSLHRGCFARFRSPGIAAHFCLIEEVQLFAIQILNLLTGLPEHPFAHAHQLFVQRLHLHQLLFQLLVFLLQLLCLLLKRLDICCHFRRKILDIQIHGGAPSGCVFYLHYTGKRACTPAKTAFSEGEIPGEKPLRFRQNIPRKSPSR